MTTLMRNGRDRRSGEPAKCHAIDKRVLLVGTRSAEYIRASGQSGRIQRPDTWLHPNASLRWQIPLATRAPSIHGTSLRLADTKHCPQLGANRTARLGPLHITSRLHHFYAAPPPLGARNDRSSHPM